MKRAKGGTLKTDPNIKKIPCIYVLSLVYLVDRKCLLNIDAGNLSNHKK